MPTKQCAEGSRLEGVMVKAIQQQVDAPSEQTGAAATKAENEFLNQRNACPECEIPAARPT
jgi:hypothetical protein